LGRSCVARAGWLGERSLVRVMGCDGDVMVRYDIMIICARPKMDGHGKVFFPLKELIGPRDDIW